MLFGNGVRVYGAVGADHLGGGIVDRDLLARGVHPLAEIAVVHFGRWDAGGRRRRAHSVAEAFVGEEEEGFVFAVVDLRDPDRAAEAAAEIVLLVDRAGNAGGVAEEAVGVESRCCAEIRMPSRGDWLVPDLEEKVITPPPAWPYSALKPLVSTVNSVIASSDGAFEETQLCRECAAGVGGDAVEGGAVAGSLSAAQHEAVVAAQVLGFGRQCRQIEGTAQRAAHHQRQLVHHLVGYGDAGLGVRRLQLRRGRGHFNGGLGFPNLHLDVNANAGRGIDRDTRPNFR